VIMMVNVEKDLSASNERRIKQFQDAMEEKMTVAQQTIVFELPLSLQLPSQPPLQPCQRVRQHYLRCLLLQQYPLLHLINLHLTPRQALRLLGLLLYDFACIGKAVITGKSHVLKSGGVCNAVTERVKTDRQLRLIHAVGQIDRSFNITEIKRIDQ